MAAYLLVDISIHDRAAMEAYEKNVLTLFASVGGRPIAYDEAPTVVEGEWNSRVVIFEFPSKDSITGVLNSEAYRPWRDRRIASSTGRSVAVAGV